VSEPNIQILLYII